MKKERLFGVLPAIIIIISLFVLQGCSRQRIVFDAGKTQSTAPEHTEKNGTDEPESKQESEPESSETQITESGSPKETGTTGGGSISSEGSQKINTKSESTGNTVKTPDDSGSQGKPSDEGGVIGAIVAEYTDLLNEGVGTLYFCYKLKVYFETETDYLTVSESTNKPLHKLITDSGGDNLAGTLKNAEVDDSWIKTKKPDVIIKLVNPSILGAGVTDTNAAISKYSELTSRDGWNEISAVFNQKVILLSSELMNTEHGKLIAKLYIARAMNPELFSNLDVDAVCSQIFGAGGIYYFGF